MADKTMKELYDSLRVHARATIAQWENVEAMIASGKLIKRAGGWYELADNKDFAKVSKLVPKQL
jgi:hypothetical protein